MALFDRVQRAVVRTAQAVYADMAIWTPSDDVRKQCEQVMYKSPNTLIEVGQQEKFGFRPYDYSIEYYEGQFPTLKSLVDGGSEEIVEVCGVKLAIRQVYTKFDGRVYEAYGELMHE